MVSLHILQVNVEALGVKQQVELALQYISSYCILKLTGLIALVCEHMAYKFCDHKVTGEDHLVSTYI